MDFLRDIWDTEGPLGTPMKDKQALAVEELLKGLPRTEDYQPRRVLLKDAMTEFAPGERADVSWISTEDRDRDLEVVISKGMNDEAFKLNPIVTVNHSYYCPPAGRSLWRKVVKDSSRVGIKAKTVYPQRPDHLPKDSTWVPDEIFPLVEHGLLNGKSIGFLPTRVTVPSDEDKQKEREKCQDPISLLFSGAEWNKLDAILQGEMRSTGQRIVRILGNRVTRFAKQSRVRLSALT
jgi:hypothetical protein